MARERPPKKTIELWIGPVRISGKKTAFEWVQRIYRSVGAGVAVGGFLVGATATVYGLCWLAAQVDLHFCG